MLGRRFTICRKHNCSCLYLLFWFECVCGPFSSLILFWSSTRLKRPPEQDTSLLERKPENALGLVSAFSSSLKNIFC